MKVYFNWEKDVEYLGEEFHARHLLNSFATTGAGSEVSGLQRIALSHYHWECLSNGSWDHLREGIYSLKSRPPREVRIVPEDQVGALDDRWYYKRQGITLLEPEYPYHFMPNGGERATTVLENLQAWFGRLWEDDPPKAAEEDGSEDDEGVTVAAEDGSEREWTQRVPQVCVRSIRRNGRTLADFQDGLWGMMRLWAI